MSQQGRWSVLRITMVHETVGWYLCILCSEPYAIDMRMLIVRTPINNEVNQAEVVAMLHSWRRSLQLCLNAQLSQPEYVSL